MSNEKAMTGRINAGKWLTRQLQKYGNTYNFPANVQAQLNKKIRLYGNTFFWR